MFACLLACLLLPHLCSYTIKRYPSLVLLIGQLNGILIYDGEVIQVDKVTTSALVLLTKDVVCDQEAQVELVGELARAYQLRKQTDQFSLFCKARQEG